MSTVTPASPPTSPPGDGTTPLYRDHQRSRGVAASPVATAWVCLMCPREVSSAVSCCSERCVRAADRELQDNLRALRHLEHEDHVGAATRQLAERTGHLSSAVLRQAVHRPHSEPDQRPDPGHRRAEPLLVGPRA